jgi:hypothetical protein
MATEGTPLPNDTTVAHSNSPSTTSSPTSLCRKQYWLLAILGVAVAAVALVSLSVHSRRSSRSKERQSCRDLQPGQEWAVDEIIDSYDNDPFDFSLVQYKAGYFYSYKHQNTSETKGPKILVMTDSETNSHVTNAYSWGLLNCYFCSQDRFYLLQLSIGKNSSGGGDVWAGLANYEDGNVTIDPSVVHVHFNNVTYRVYNDTVFLVSYWTTNRTLQVEKRDIDLSAVTLSKCGMKSFLQENTELSAYFAKWQAWWKAYYDSR